MWSITPRTACGSYRTRCTKRSAGNAIAAPQVHQRLVELPDRIAPSRQQPVGKIPNVFLRGSVRARWAKHAGKHAADVRVDGGCTASICKTRNGTRSVSPDTGKLLEYDRIVGNLAVVLGNDGSSELEQVRRAAIVAEAVPGLAHTARLRSSQRRDRRKSCQKTAVVIGHSTDLRLLQHELRHQNTVRISRRPPRQVSTFPAKPCKQSSLELIRIFGETGIHRHMRRYHDGVEE